MITNLLKNSLIYIFIFSGFIPLQCQEVVDNFVSDVIKTNALRTLDDRLEGKRVGATQDAKLGYANVTGSPYLFNKPLDSEIIMNDDQVIDKVQIQYDLNKNVLIASLKKSDEQILLDNSSYKLLKVNDGDKTRTFSKIHPVISNDFFEVLFVNDDFTFFKKERARVRSITHHVIGEIKTTHKFKKYVQYYLIDKDNELIEVKLKKGDLYKHLPDNSMEAIRNYSHDHKLKRINKEDEIVELFEAAL